MTGARIIRGLLPALRRFAYVLSWALGLATPGESTLASTGAEFGYDATAPLDWQVITNRPRDGATLSIGSFASPRGGRVPALLVRPNGTGPFAGVVFMHPGGGPQGKDFFFREAIALAPRGAVSVMIDGPFMRTNGPPLLSFDERDQESWVQAVVDLRRAIDLLAAQPDVDTNRLAFVGFSYGATLGGVLCGVDDRVRHFVLMGGGPRLTDWLSTLAGPGPERLKREQRWESYLAGMRRFDSEQYVPHAQGVSVLLQNGIREGRQDSARGYLELIGADPRELRFYDAGHDPGPQAMHDRLAWLGRPLGLKASDDLKPGAEFTSGYVNGLFYETRGHGEPVVFMHGGQLDRRLWDDQFPLFAQDYLVVRYDARGFGKSASPTNAFTHEGDLHTLLDHLGIQRARLVGLSLGGRTALNYVVKHPERVSALVLVAPGLDGHPFRDPAGRDLWKIGRAAREGHTNAVAELWLANPYMAPATELEPLRARLRQLVAENARGWLNGVYESGPVPSPYTLLNRIQASTLLMIGDRDVSDIQQIVAKLQTDVPGARTERFKGAGHMLNLERPAEFNAALRQFLDGLQVTKQPGLTP